MELVTDNAPVSHRNENLAGGYTDRWAAVAAMKDALHLCMRLVLSGLPTEARVLCVGVGDGAELLYLADAFPQWRFTALEPSARMLEMCRARADAQKVSSRCAFHEGYIDTLPDDDKYDAATAILVSHYLGDPAARLGFFRAIYDRLRPGGVLVNADLAADTTSLGFARLFEVWKTMLSFSGMSSEEVDAYCKRFGKGMSVIPVPEIEAIISSSGFKDPNLFCQTLLIYAWHSRR